MGYKTILVHMDHHKRSEVRLKHALDLAQTFESHLLGVHVDQFPIVPSYATEGSSVAVTQAMLRRGRDLADQAHQMFDEGIRLNKPKGAVWKSVEGIVEQGVANMGRYADLIVVGQPHPDDDEFPRLSQDFPASLSLSVARPILVVPYTGQFNKIASNIVIAWNGSRESSRAVTDALPLLKRANKVTIMTVNPPEDVYGNALSGDDLANYLSHHKIDAKLATQKRVDINPGEWILSRAADTGADLIVMGTYGRWRIRELLLGGVTRTLSCAMTAPVLMSH